MKRLQNKIAGSRTSLPVAFVYSAVVWLLAGLIQDGLWLQYGCFALSALLVMRMNNRNLLIRIFSRSVSVSFIVLFCAAVFLFHSWKGGIAQVCVIASLLLLYDCYQDKTAIERTYYLFLILGIGSFFDIHVFLYVPVFWLMMKVIVYSICWRTFLSSLLGLITPYWLLAGWAIYHYRESFIDHFTHDFVPEAFSFSYGVDALSPIQMGFILFTVFLMVFCSIHFIRKSYLDKIRVRQLYYSFILLAGYSLLIILLLPDHEGLAIRVLILATSPLLGHFMALTNTRLTNIAFCILTAAILLLTGFNLWTSSSIF